MMEAIFDFSSSIVTIEKDWVSTTTDLANSRKLDSFKTAVENVISSKSVTATENIAARKYVKKITDDFEKNMNDNLNTRKTLDDLFHTVSRLNVLKKQGEMTLKDCKETLDRLKAIDNVLQVIFTTPSTI